MKKEVCLWIIFVIFQVSSNAQEDSSGAKTTKPKNEPALTGKETKTDTVKLSGDSMVLWNNTIVLFKKNDKKDAFKHSHLNISFGYNFDFLDGIKTNELYADVNANFPNLFRKKVKRTREIFWDKIGLEAGAYQIRTISRLDTVAEQFRLTDAIQIPPDSLAILYITANSTTIRKTIRENLNVFLQPKFELLENEETKVNFLLHAEWLRSILNHKLDRNNLSIDTSYTPPPGWPRPYNTVSNVPESETSKNFEYNVNFGLGLDIRVKKDEGNFYLKTVCGYNKAKFLEQKGLTSLLSGTNGWFYLVKFEILETKITGIKLGVEVRGLFPHKKPEINIERAVPSFSVYLAKQFTFEKIGELFKP